MAQDATIRLGQKHARTDAQEVATDHAQSNRPALTTTILARDDARSKQEALQRFQALAMDSPRAKQLKTVQKMMVAAPRTHKAGVSGKSAAGKDTLSQMGEGQEQYSTGRKMPSMQMRGIAPVSDDQGLERHGMGAKALTSGGTLQSDGTSSARVLAASAASTVQLKSVFNSVTPKKSGADTPLKTLHDNFGPLMAAAGLASQYSFQSALPNVMHNDGRYAGSWAKAGSVEATLDSASRFKSDSKNRNNKVIGPYGHFGIMERAIHHRQDLGNTYDGGHLVEHTLMEGQDADVHGNLAPQQNKDFNQGLMRGWESIAENYMDNYTGTWNYKVELGYTDDSYSCTGADLIAAGVIPKLAETNLSKLVTPRDAELTGKTATFERWVPYAWSATLDRSSGSDFPSLSLTHGAHMHNLMSSHTSAKDEVFSTSLTPPLVRTNSGTLGGYFPNYGMVPGSTTTGMVGGSGVPLLNAYMYQPVPQPSAYQPIATSSPSGKVPVPMPPTKQVVHLLSADVSMANLQSELQAMSLKSETSGKILADATLVLKAKGASSNYAIMHPLFENSVQRAKFIKAVYYSTSPLTKATWPDIVKGLRQHLTFGSLVLDPRLKP